MSAFRYTDAEGDFEHGGPVNTVKAIAQYVMLAIAAAILGTIFFPGEGDDLPPGCDRVVADDRGSEVVCD